MTPQEFDYIRRAMDALNSPECTEMTRVKILRTISQITDRAARTIEQNYIDRVDTEISAEYQRHLNKKLVDTLRG
jgi:hypothetical protein